MTLGLALVLAVCIGGPCSLWVIGSNDFTWSHFPDGVGIPFLFLVAGNILLRWLRPGWVLSPAELITIIVMGLVVTGIPIFLVGYLLSIPTTPHYFASPENQWGRYVVPYLPDWLLPSNEGLAMTWFFEGLPFGQPVPWSTLLQAWVFPLAMWLTFIGALYFACFVLVVILRKQWVERERLDFPLMRVPEALLERGTGSSPVPALLRSRVFWIGAALPLGIILWNISGYFYHFIPQIPFHYQVQVARGFPTMEFNLNGPIIGFMYFVNLNVSFSIWFFYLLTTVEEGIFNRFGIGVTEGNAFVWGLPSTSWQSWGAFVFMVLWGLWMARSHLRDVIRKALDSRHPVDDRGELLPYRIAVTGFAVALLYMLVWLNRAGMSWPVAGLFLACVLIAYLGITRLVIQGGVYFVSTPVVAQAMTMETFGANAISPHGLGALGLSYSFFGDVQSVFMPSAAHAARLRDRMQVGRTGLSVAILLAVVVGFAASIGCILYMGYDQGASNFNSWFYRVSSGAGVLTFNDVMGKVKNPAGPDGSKLGFFGAGGLLMGALTFMQYRFPWWPLHPIGLTIASVWMIRRQAAAIFLAWSAKTVILRFGGLELYRRAAPFFIGLILGQWIGVGISFVVDLLFFYGDGHVIMHA